MYIYIHTYRIYAADELGECGGVWGTEVTAPPLLNIACLVILQSCVGLRAKWASGPSGPSGQVGLRAKWASGPGGPPGQVGLRARWASGPSGPPGRVGLRAEWASGPSVEVNKQYQPAGVGLVSHQPPQIIPLSVSLVTAQLVAIQVEA